MKLTRLFAFALVAALAATGIALPAPVPADAKEDAKKELAQLAGTWKVVSYQDAGVELLKGEDPPEMVITFKKDGAFAWKQDDDDSGAIARIDPSKKVKEIDYTFNSGDNKGKTQKAIYKLEGDTFTDCFSPPGEDRPTEFKSTKENGFGLVVYKRMKKID